jgi:hypothetical protein
MSGNVPKNKKFSCPNNAGVECWYKEKPCKTCGWNPEVEKARLERITNPHTASKIPKKQ